MKNGVLGGIWPMIETFRSVWTPYYWPHGLNVMVLSIAMKRPTIFFVRSNGIPDPLMSSGKTRNSEFENCSKHFEKFLIAISMAIEHDD